MDEWVNEWCMLPLKFLGVQYDDKFTWELLVYSCMEAYYDIAVFIQINWNLTHSLFILYKFPK